MIGKKKRYKRTLKYIREKIDAGLAADILVRTTGKESSIGGELSLSGAGYKWGKNSELRSAVRALKLCHITYFRPPHAPFDFATSEALKSIHTGCKHDSVETIKQKIKYFTTKEGASLSDLANAAEIVCDVTGNVDNFTRSRNDTNVSLNPVCYHGVVAWLFKSGFVSKKWLAKEGNTLTGYTANSYIGEGQIVPSESRDQIQRGFIWNIHRVNDPSTCHWGVSLGNNRAVACNNTDSSPGVNLNYHTGNTQYGIFDFTNICDVLNANAKYGHTGDGAPGENIVVKKINPEIVTEYY